jgi:hypothetical protein
VSLHVLISRHFSAGEGAHTGVVLAGTAHPRPVLLNVDLAPWVVEAKEATGKNWHKVLLVVDVRRVERRVDQVRKGLIARLPSYLRQRTFRSGTRRGHSRGAAHTQYAERSRPASLVKGTSYR